MRKLYVCLMAVLVMALGFTACSQFDDMKEIDEVTWSGDLALPLINSSISLQEVLNELDEEDIDFLNIDEDSGRMNVFYEDEPRERKITTFIGETLSFPLLLVDTSMTFPTNWFENVEVRRLAFKSGTLSFNLESPYQEDIDLTITIPELTKNGQPFEVNRFIDYQGSAPTTVNIAPISIEGYAMEVPAGTITVNYVATRMNGTQIKFNYITGEALDWTFSDMTGHWSPVTYEIKKDSIEIEIYDDWVGGDLRFEDPRLNIQVDNSFGFATQVSVKSLLVRTVDGKEIVFESEVLNNAFSLAYPSLTEVGSAKTTVFSFTKENSNIVDIVNSKPVAIIYELEALVNAEPTMEEMGFMTAESAITTTVSIDLPIVISASNFSIEEYVDINLDDIEEIREAEFKLITSNSIPVEFGLQFYFVDENKVVIDSLFDTALEVIAAAAVDTEGEVTQAADNTLLIPIPGNRMEQIKGAKQMLLNASMSTSEKGTVPVRILTTQALDVKLGVKVGLETNP